MSPELKTGHDVRLASRSKTLTSPTSGLAPSYLQANLIVVPSRYASDFRLLCARNPVPCPLLAESSHPGSFSTLKSYVQVSSSSSSSGPPAAVDIATDIDLRHDAPAYRVYWNGVLVDANDAGGQTEIADIEAEWTEDHVGFLIGCSYSFEAALDRAGLPARHSVQGRNVPMYRTNIPLCPAGVFTGATYVVSMRPYRAADVERVREVTRPFVQTHGEPIAWGWAAVEKLGIKDIASPEWGQKPLGLDGKTDLHQACTGSGDDGDYVPVFWGCGVTPQNAVMAAKLEGTVMAHAPGHMFVLDVQDEDVFPVGTREARAS